MELMLYLILGLICVSLVFYWGSSLFKVRFAHKSFSGEVFVNGKNTIGINLACNRAPKSVYVNFTHTVHSHPCHPCNTHQDKFDWEVVKINNCYQLIIHYDVGNVREIFYRVIY